MGTQRFASIFGSSASILGNILKINNNTRSAHVGRKMDKEPDISKDAVLQESVAMPEGTPIVKGYDWNQGIDYIQLLSTYINSGFQATNFGKAVNEINKMLELRKIPLQPDDEDLYEDDEFIRRKHQCTIFFGYTSNMVSSGLREHIRFLVQNKLIDCIVTTAGNIISVAQGPTYISFNI